MPACVCQPLQQQPALVERAAGDGELAALEIGERLDRRLRRHHHRAERAGRGIEHQLVAERALARHPQPVRQHHVGGAAASAILPASGLASSVTSSDRSASLSRPPARMPPAPRRTFRSSAPPGGWYPRRGRGRLVSAPASPRAPMVDQMLSSPCEPFPLIECFSGQYA